MRNAFTGYTYQQEVLLLLLAIMDVKRNILKLKFEADVNNNFDDIVVTLFEEEFYFQIKDFENISLNEITIEENLVRIKGKKHKLSPSINVLILNNFETTPNDEILGLPAFNYKGLYIISLSRGDIGSYIERLYIPDPIRIRMLENFLSSCLDMRIWRIQIKDLPPIKVFRTDLMEQTINLGNRLEGVNNLVLIEGKPGVGKSHYVNILINLFENSLTYRFWISNQDSDYERRLKYDHFLHDISKKLYNDQNQRSKYEIFEKLKVEEKLVIIDGLDHVENYNSEELHKYVDFVNELKRYTKVIILSRPLVIEHSWEKVVLENWNERETAQFLHIVFHIDKYSIRDKIYKITNGYPILVKYLAEHYKLRSDIPELGTIESIDDYYAQIIKNEKGKTSLSVFLCVRSFLMKSEIEMLLVSEYALILNEYIKEHPYLFEIKLNRVSLIHDSFNTFLKKRSIDYKQLQKKVNNRVYESIMNRERRFLSRFTHFDFDPDEKKNIIRKYCSMSMFQLIINGAIDYEAIREFYVQIRESLKDLKPDELEVTNYYDLSLILNLIYRDHVSHINEFIYTYIKSLLFHGYTEDDITSSKYLFGMLLYVKLKDPLVLYNILSDDNYLNGSLAEFSWKLYDEIKVEESFFHGHEEPLSVEEIDQLLTDINRNLVYVLANIYIHDTYYVKFKMLCYCINALMNGREEEAGLFLSSYLSSRNHNSYSFIEMDLKNAKKEILACGTLRTKNHYKEMTLYDFIKTNQDLGSFEMREDIQNYIRLALYESRQIDIESVSLFWTMYYQRKDYSLLTIGAALYSLECRGSVTKLECIELIHRIQDISEKARRFPLYVFIEQYKPEIIIPYIISNCKVGDLIIDWFLLPVEYINFLTKEVIIDELDDLMRYNRYNKEINIEELKYVLRSKWKSVVEKVLNKNKYIIRAAEEHPLIDEIKDSRLSLKLYPKEETYRSKEGEVGVSSSAFDRGELTTDNKHLIVEKNMRPQDVASFSDGWHSVLADIDLFDVFEPKEVKNNFKEILYNALLSKFNSVDAFNAVYYLPGNIVKMIHDYEVDTDFNKIVDSFLMYLEFSMFPLTVKKLN